MDFVYYQIFSDYVYKQDKNFNYTKSPVLESVNQNERFNYFKQLAYDLFSRTVPKDVSARTEPRIDPALFNQAVSKFSRDVYGLKRLEARLSNISDTEALKEIKKYKDYGFKVDSNAPYQHRVVAVFLYWFSILKPFSIHIPQGLKPNKRLALLLNCFNEYMSYYIIQAALSATDMRLDIDSYWEYFEDFLTDLHFRNLSRSSLEFFLASYQVYKEPI